jgi:hypothetical protein
MRSFARGLNTGFRRETLVVFSDGHPQTDPALDTGSIIAGA